MDVNTDPVDLINLDVLSNAEFLIFDELCEKEVDINYLVCRRLMNYFY